MPETKGLSESSSVVRSVERALDLLLAMESARRPIGVRELARVSGVPRATVQRLLSTLESRGFVQGDDGRYQLGASAVSLASSFASGNTLARTAAPILQQLAAASGETVSLYVRQGLDRVVVQRVSSPHPLRYSIQVGERLPLYVGAPGQVLAAAMPEGELRILLNGLDSIRLASGDALTKRELMAKLERVRQQGFAISIEERTTGVIAVAAPVVTPDKGTVAAVAVVGPPSRMPQEKIDYLIDETRHAAREMAQGYIQL